MYAIFLIIWIIFNEKINIEILLFGLAIAAVLFAFVCKFMDHSIQKEIGIYKKCFRMLHYAIILLKEILMANLSVCRLILSEKEEIEPALVDFTSKMRTPAGRAFYANAITLTPGTITVIVEDDKYLVHCLDQEMAEGLTDSDLEQLLYEMEE